MENKIYGEYLRWFQDRAKEGSEPRDEKGIFHTFLFSRIAYKCEAYVLDEAYFITWIHPRDSRNGDAKWFLFAEADMRLIEPDGDVSSDAVQTTYRCIAQI